MEALPIIAQSYELYKHFTDIHGTLAKRWRYSLGINTEETILHFLEQVLMAKTAPKTLKAAYLIKASALLEIIALKLRLILEMKLSNETRIFQLQARVKEIGKMLGGWLKASQSK